MINITCYNCKRSFSIRETDLLTYCIEKISRTGRTIQVICPYCGKEAQVFYMNEKLLKRLERQAQAGGVNGKI